jgi:4-hydroxybenzoate polyprenyltransferase
MPGERAAGVNTPPSGLDPTGKRTSRFGALRLVVETMRPKQWTKNGFVLGGLLFSGRALETSTAIRSLATFAAFCALSGGMYLVNDVADAETDHLNPRTARRPVARGALSKRAAIVAAFVATAMSLGVATWVNWQTLGILGAFCALQLAYSAGLRRLFLVDVLVISAGFVLRALAGIVAIEAIMSPWLLLDTGLLALFLALTKRRGEAAALVQVPSVKRAVLSEYSIGLVDQLIAVVTPTTLVVYAIYGVLGAHSQLMLLTLPLVIYGIFRVLYLMQREATSTEDPSTIMWRDHPLLVCIVLWGLLAGAIAVTTF